MLSIVIHGGIDKSVLTKDSMAIDEEIKGKLPLMVRMVGYLCTVDHKILLGSSYKNVLYFMKRVKECFN